MCSYLLSFCIYLFFSFVVICFFFFCLVCYLVCFFFFFSSRRRHTRCLSDWSSDVCSSDLPRPPGGAAPRRPGARRRLHRGRGGADPRVSVQRQLLPVRPGPPHRPALSREIGRASCRERV